MTRLRLSFLGMPKVQYAGQVLNFRTRKALALLIYLVVEGGFQAREKLIEFLWPMSDAHRGQMSLRRALTFIRQTLGDIETTDKPYILVERDGLSFNPATNFELDLNIVDAAWHLSRVHGDTDPVSYQERGTRLQAAVDRYGADFLEGFSLPNTLAFDNWASLQREIYHQRMDLIFGQLSQMYFAENDLTSAIETGLHWVAHNNLNEAAHRHLMAVYSAKGDRTSALHQYQECKELLIEEFGVPPQEDTKRLYERILNKGEAVQSHSEAPSFYPLASRISTPRQNLPAQSTPLIGRKGEIAAIRERLLHPNVRLVTLTGAGGTGKTRLGLQVAADLLDYFEQGVFFVSLADINDPTLITSSVARQLGVREGGDLPLLENLKTHLRDKQILLLLDNFEHVVAAAPVIAELLTAAPKLKVLVTSRALLHLRGEHEFPVPPMSLPDLSHFPPVEQLRQYEAIQLFVERAQAAKSTFILTNENALAIAEICHHLDGLPLAIELAAARIKLLPPQTLLERLSSRLKLLIGGAQDLPARQQTLRNTIDWSYNLLTKDEQTLFARLGVFAGGCTLEAAEAICTLEGSPSTQAEPALNILEGVESLINKSLLQQEEAENGRPRFRMLETIREYALERLLESGEMEIMRRQHARYFASVSEEAGQKLFSSEASNWLVKLETEHDNLRAALDWSHMVSDGVEIGSRIVGSIWWFWYRRGYLSEGRERLERVLALTDLETPSAARASMLIGGGALAIWQANLATAGPMMEESVIMWRWLENEFGLALALTGNGVLLINQGDDMGARTLLEESLAICMEFEFRWLQAITLMHFGNVAMGLGDYTKARIWLEKSSTLAQEIGDNWVTASVLNNLGELARCLQDYDRAQGYYEESGTLFRETGDKLDVARSIHSLGYVAQNQGDLGRAKTCFRESLTMFRELGNKRGIAECLAGLAGLAIEQAQVERAGRLLSMGKTLLDMLGAAWWPADRIEFERNQAALKATLDERAFATVWAEGIALPLEQAIGYALDETLEV